jgi:outer membrane protein assembly factor BamB
VGSGVSTPVIGRDGTLYCLLSNGRLLAMRPSGRVLWSVPAGQTSAVPGVALGDDGAVFVSCNSIGIKAFNADGTLRWLQSQGNPFTTPPTISQSGAILVGNYVQSGPTLWCFDRNGSNLWSAVAGGPHRGAAAINADGTAYFSGYGGKLSAFSTTGSNVWELPLGTASLSSPAIALDGTIYIGGQDGKLRSVFGSSPLANSSWPMFQHDEKHTDRDPRAPVQPEMAESVSTSDGTYNDRVRVAWLTAPAAGAYEVWRHTSNDSNSAVRIAENVAGQTYFDDKTAVPGTNYYYWVRAKNETGAGAFSDTDAGYRRVAVPGEPLGDSRPVDAAGTSPSLGFDGTIYVGAASGLKMYALAPDLTKDWELTLGAVSTPAIGEGGEINTWVSNGRFYSLEPGGASDWWFVGSYDTHLPAALTSDGAIIVAARNQTVSCYDPANASFRWQYAAGSPITAAPAVGTDGTVFFGTQDGQLHALNADGSLRWRFRTGGRIQSSPAVGTDGVVYFGSDDRGIYAVGPDGHRRWAAQAGGIVTASPVIAPDDTVIIGSQDGRMYAFWPNGIRRWDFLAESAIQSSACIGADGMVYFGTYNGWVYGLNREGKRMWAFNSATNGLSGRVLDSPLLLEDRLLVPIYSSGLQALSVTAGPAEVNWPQYRHDSKRTGRANTWLLLSPLSASGRVAGETLSVHAQFTLVGSTIQCLELLSGTNVVSVVTGGTNLITWSPVTEGTHQLSLRVLDDAGNVHVSLMQTSEIAPPPRLGIFRAASGKLELDVNTVVGRQYQLECSTNFGVWNPIGETLIATNSIQLWTESNPASGAAYYRARLLP